LPFSFEFESIEMNDGSLLMGASTLNFGNIEVLMRTLVDKVNAQGVEIHRLQSELARKASTEDLVVANRASKPAIDALAARVDSLQAAISLDSPAGVGLTRHADGIPIIGAYVAANSKAIATLMREVRKKADISELAAVEQDMRGSMDREMQQVRDAHCGRYEMDKLEEAQVQFHKQLGTLQESVHGKMDKGEFSHLEAVAAKIRNFGVFTERVERRLDGAEEGLGKLEELCSAHSRAHIQAENTSDDIRKEGAEQDRRHKQNMAKLLQSLELATKQLREKAATSALQAALGKQAELERRIDHVGASLSDLDDRHKMSVGTTQQELDKRATVVELATKADAARCDKILLGLQSGLRRKASCEALLQAEGSIGRLDHECADLQKKTGVAIRFIDWFSERGTAYEHNFNVVERQLSQLSAQSAPNKQEPYQKWQYRGDGGAR
jgi:hypothetical protein